MNAADTGGPAFPLHSEVRPGLDTEWVGMTLRDYFAAKALQALVLNKPPHLTDEPPSSWAEDAYDFADAMLAVRCI